MIETMWRFYAIQICLTRRIALFSSLFLLLAISIAGAMSVKAADSRGQLVMITPSVVVFESLARWVSLLYFQAKPEQ